MYVKDSPGETVPQRMGFGLSILSGRGQNHLPPQRTAKGLRGKTPSGWVVSTGPDNGSIIGPGQLVSCASESGAFSRDRFNPVPLACST
ncbi:hypothetical protein GCM10017687_55990 [Streptomyces echinatus]